MVGFCGAAPYWQEQALKAKLVGIKGQTEGQIFILDQNRPIIFGRSESATIRLNDTGVSRAHCSIEYDDGFYVVEDLGSRNGTWINGKRISRAKLVHYDSIAIGSQEIRFELEPTLEDNGTEFVIFEDDRPKPTEVCERMNLESSVEIIALEPTEESIENYRQLQRDLAAICRVSKLVHLEEDIEKLFGVILDNVMEITQADRCYILLPYGPKRELKPVTARVKRNAPEQPSHAYSRTLTQQCFSSGFSILRSDFSDSSSEISESVIDQHITSVMCVPLQSREGQVGVIYVDNLSGSHSYKKRDLEVLAAVGNQAGIAIRRAQLAERVERLFSDTITTLVSVLEAKDDYTKGHSDRVTAVALRIGQIVKLRQEELKDLHLAGLMHDIGKIAIEKQILQKPTSLTTEEYNDIKQHPIIGEKVISSIDNAERIALAIRHHHEAWDGGGYPDGIANDQIPVLARILAIADAFDSMVSHRPYKRNFSLEEVIAEFRRCSGQQFDPALADLFVEHMEKDSSFLAGISEIYDNAISEKLQVSQSTHP